MSENGRARVGDNHLLWTKTGTDMHYIRAGDLNRDGALSPTDAVITLRMAVTSLDAMMILQAAAGAIDSL